MKNLNSLTTAAILTVSVSGFAQNVGIGTAVPTSRLHVAGTFRLVDGTEAAGEVLTTDASGNASWQPASGGGGTLDYAYDFGGPGLGSIITADAGAFSVFGTDGIRVTGTYGVGAAIGSPGAGTRMWFNPRKGAFRAGRVTGVEWNEVSVGDYSTAFGYSSTASADFSVAMGGFNTASGNSSTAMGNSTVASGVFSTAMGNSSTATGGNSIGMGSNSDATGDYSIAIGADNTAQGVSSTAIGYSNIATGDYSTGFGYNNLANGLGSTTFGVNNWASGDQSTAMGMATVASGQYSTAMGFNTGASGNYSTALGRVTSAIGLYSTAMGDGTVANGISATAMGSGTVASGTSSTAMGANTSAESGYETTIGRWNTDYAPVSTAGWDVTDRLFVAGNGTAVGSRSDAMVILKNGNTGIGVSAPSHKLELGGTSSQLYMNSATSNHLVFNPSGVDVPTTTTRSAGTKIVFYPGLSATTVDYAMGINGYTLWHSIPEGNSFYQHQFYGGTSPLMTVRGDGNVGIGTTAPDNKVDIVGSVVRSGTHASGRALYVTGTFAPNSGGVEFRHDNGTQGVGIGYSAIYATGSNADQDLGMESRGIGVLYYSTNSSERMRITGAGNVGIGTTIPRGHFDVDGAGDIYLADDPNAGTTQSLFLPGHTYIAPYNGSDIAYLQARRLNDVGTVALRLRTLSAGFVQESVHITGGGLVGINNTAPVYMLEVNGSAGKPGGGSWTASSDTRLKKNVIPYTDGLDQVLSINPIRYNYNELSGHDMAPEYVGVIAQELKEVASCMVGSFEREGEEYLNVDNSAMIYMLINAIKEQQAQINALKEALGIPR